jgi:hypothetical protein
MPSEDYYRALALADAHHEKSQGKTFSGRFTWKQRKRIKEVIDRVGATSLLDYGCGFGKQYDPVDKRNHDETGRTLEQFWGLGATKYDPAVRRYKAEPRGKFDIVICIQVLTSIPRADLPWVIDRLYGFANKAIFVAERLKMPRKLIFARMADAMPYGFSIDDWMMLLRRPSSPVSLTAFFHDENGWSEQTPGDQGLASSDTTAFVEPFTAGARVTGDH